MLRKCPFAVDDADRKEAGFVLTQGQVSALVDEDCAVWGEAVEQPEVAVANRGG